MKNIVITILAILVLGLGGYLVYDKVIDKDVKEEVKEEQNSTTNNNVEQEQNDTTNNYVEQEKVLVGMFEASVLGGVNAAGENFYKLYKLNIKEDKTCDFSTSVSGGSGVTYLGTCTFDGSFIILTANKKINDAETTEIN